MSVDLRAVFSSEQLTRRLATNLRIGKSVFCYDSVGSTNDVAHRFAKDGARSGTIILAEFQTAGRGRGAKRWTARRGENIIASVILRPNAPLERLTLLPLLAAVAIAQTIEEEAETRAEIKWPNDVLTSRKKVAGILIETATQNAIADYVVLGVGLNVNQTEFPDELLEQATSLRLETGKTFDLSDVFVALMKNLDALYARFENGNDDAILQMWRAHCQMFGKRVTFVQNGERREGVALDIDERGFLKVRIDCQETLLSQAEIADVRY
ncbi:MAG: biotin--[acetyl-CoA-carboxylase] ligase [Chloroherpetonaceae bacterium]|nr:biotin--[acetyl-CoA-carboxylase] ligase [Chloroherpetonaceae bacterium]MDW8437523.1 biotin--[acetyl-CoA-carboxylase] ligase [Chloroherpetonaceae bacterium]